MSKGTNITKTLDKVTKLIKLATSPNEQEARTAAYQACKLINEHGLSVVAGEPETPHRAAGGRSYGVWDFVSDFTKAASNFERVETGKKVVFCNAKYSGGSCGACGGTISRGARIVWYPRKGIAYHQACADELRKAGKLD